MASIFDYLTWRGDLDFDTAPLNPVDYLIFSQLSYLPFDGIVLAPEEKKGIYLPLAMEAMQEKLKTSRFGQKLVLTFKEDPDLIKALISSERYKNCYLLGYVNKIDIEKELQFSALCIYIDKKSFAVIFRGTDMSFVGWKEDFNMAFREIIPAQQEALKYLETMSAVLDGDIHIAGHSKGGNLAVYAATYCNKNIQKRIADIHSYDAPGFHESIFNSEDYINIKSKIKYFIPQGSIIGLLLERDKDYKVVKSKQIGLLQHILYSWEVTKNDLVPVENTTVSSRYLDKTLREWINSLDNNQREQFIDGVYKIISSSETKTVQEMENAWLLSLGKILLSITHIDKSTRNATIKTMVDLARSAGRNLDTFFKG